MSRLQVLAASAAALLLALGPRPAQAAVERAVPAAKAVRDDVYLQEVGRRVPSSEPLTAVGLDGQAVFAGTAHGLLRLDGTNWTRVAGMTGAVTRLAHAGGRLWAAGASGLARRDGDAWTAVSREPVTDVVAHRGTVVASAGRRLWRVEGTGLVPFTTNEAPFAVARVLSHQDTLWVAGDGRLAPLSLGRFGGPDVYGFPADQSWDWGALPSPAASDALATDSRIVVATDRGLGVLRGMSMTAVRGAEGLPVEDARCLARGFMGDVWVGTGHGAVRWVDGVFHYFAGRRWLPDDRVNAIASGDRVVYVATDGGLGIIAYEPYTLLKKASYYERHLEEWGQKRLGIVHKLEWDDGLGEYVREAGDNDGGYSGDYLAAQAYRWAVTRDPAARREATNTFHTLRWLESMTGIPGFPARSLWVKGEKGHKATGGSGGYPAEWHDAADARFEWKGDTSSDELCSHFYAVGRFLELAAEGDEVRQAKEHLRRIAGHLVSHGWQLVDVDGKPTRWGRWDPEYFRTDEGHFDRGLQCVELLSFVRTAEVLAGDASMGAAHARLVELGYPGHVLRQRQTAPPEAVLHFEDQLALWSYWNLLRFEPDPELRAWYRRSFERTYEVVRAEQQPWFNFVHAVVSGDAGELAASAAHLREWPLDLRTWSYRNSHRADLRTPSGYTGLKPGGVRPFSPREREPMRWDAWTMQADGGSGGRDVVEPSGWLLAYWMGRYHGLVEAPTATDPAVLTAGHSLEPGMGAKPYTGPGRPAVP